MRIVCPSCAAAYEVQDRLLRPGRTARCAQCANQWVPLADVTPVATAEPPETPAPDDASNVPPQVVPHPAVITAMDRLSAASVRPASSPALRLAWVASVAALIALAAGLYAERRMMVAYWPASVRLYAALGVAPHAESPPPNHAN